MLYYNIRKVTSIYNLCLLIPNKILILIVSFVLYTKTLSQICDVTLPLSRPLHSLNANETTKPKELERQKSTTSDVNLSRPAVYSKKMNPTIPSYILKMSVL